MGESNLARDDQSDGLLHSDDEQSVNVKKQKRIEILMDHTMVVSTESHLEDMLVSYLFLSKKLV